MTRHWGGFRPLRQIINNTDDANWFKAEINGRTGFVPANYVEMMPHECVSGHL